MVFITDTDPNSECDSNKNFLLQAFSNRVLESELVVQRELHPARGGCGDWTGKAGCRLSPGCKRRVRGCSGVLRLHCAHGLGNLRATLIEGVSGFPQCDTRPDKGCSVTPNVRSPGLNSLRPRACSSLGEKLVGWHQRKSWVRPGSKRGTIEIMRWKSAFSVLLAVSLLGASSWAAICDVACMVQRGQPGCHVSQASSHGDYLGSMSHSHCAHMRKPGISKASPSSFVVATSSCAHSLCRQLDSVADPDKSVQFDRVQWAIVQHVLIPDQSLPSRYVSEAPPPVVVPVFNSLSVALRI
jgi:hypothetical protein